MVMTQTIEEQAVSHFEGKLKFETDPADVYKSILAGDFESVILDVRSPQAYAKSHIPGSINLPSGFVDHADPLPLDRPLIVYCWGPGCNGATKAAARLIRQGYSVKEMIGGIEYWEDKERYPVERENLPQC